MKKNVLIVAILMTHLTASATVLTFDTGLGANGLLPQDYGDHVGHSNWNSYSYGENGEGFTPSISVDYIGDGELKDLYVWGSGYGDLTNVVENEEDWERWTIIRFTADAGAEVVLHSVDIGNYNSSPLLIDSISVTNELGSVLYQQTNFVLGASSTGHTNLNFGSLTGQVLTLVLDLQTAASTSDNDSVGLDNILFSQSGSAIAPPLPENRLQNPRFATDLTSWITDSGSPDLALDSSRAYVGNYLFHFNGTVAGQIHQDVDLVAAGYSTNDIDAGLHAVVFSGWQSSHEGVDQGTIRVDFLDASPQVIDSASLPSVAPVSWTEYSATNVIPSQTTILRYVFSGEQGSGGEPQDINSYLDSMYMGIMDVLPPDVTLTVQSLYGAPEPPLGTNWMAYGTTGTCTVEQVTFGTTNYSPTGWTMTGNEPLSGTTNLFVGTLTNDAVLTWNWQTNYWIEIGFDGNGSVNLDSGFQAKDSEQNLTATPDSGWLFMGWDGDISKTNNAVVVMDGSQAITAVFSIDADNDGLTNTEEAAAGSNPWKTDTDEDGFDDAFEVAQGMSPTNDSSAVVNYIGSNGDAFGLYPSNVVLDVATGQMLLQTFNSNAVLFLQLEESDDLVSWTNAGDAVEWIWPVDGNKKFFRVRSSGEQE